MIVAIEPWTAVGASYFLVFAAISAIVIRSAQRGRRLSHKVPEEQRRWM